MDEELDRRLREIEDVAGAAAVNAGDGLDILDVRNELEDVETRLNRRLDGIEASIARLTDLVESRTASLGSRVDEVAETAQSIYGDLPTN